MINLDNLKFNEVRLRAGVPLESFAKVGTIVDHRPLSTKKHYSNIFKKLVVVANEQEIIQISPGRKLFGEDKSVRDSYSQKGGLFCKSLMSPINPNKKYNIDGQEYTAKQLLTAAELYSECQECKTEVAA